MTKRQVTHRAKCAEQGCTEWANWAYGSQAELRRHLSDLAERPWLCVRHNKPTEVLSPELAQLEQVMVASPLRDLADHLFWVPIGATTGSGFTHGPGFKAFANDFQPGTRLVVTARIEIPEVKS